MYNSRQHGNTTHYRDVSPVRPNNLATDHHVDKEGDEKFYNTSPNLEYMSDIDQGLQPYNRVGQTVTCTSLALRCLIEPDAALTTGLQTTDVVRIRLVYDKRGGGFPTYADMFKGYEDNGTEITTSDAFSNPDNNERFEILANWSFVMGYNSNTLGYWISNGPALGIIDTVIDLGGRKIQYNGTSGSSTNVIYGSMWLVMSSLRATVTNDWAMRYTARLTFRNQ